MHSSGRSNGQAPGGAHDTLAFGGLAVEFWEWARLTDAFERSMNEIVGRPVCVIRGKL